MLSRLLGDRLFQLRVPLRQGVTVGDQVQLEISETALLSAACLVYLFPLLALLSGAIVGDFLGGDGLALLFGGLMLAGSFFMLHFFRDRISHSERFQAVIVETEARP
jgi:sigma-E factor negative regulatory protein RseC